ncbi:MAG: alpha-amylase, partial [Planctomycetes bacterium]|nr:alpha-amylase [Planctomycetota bacterium]
MAGPRIYNLFPRLAGTMERWPAWFRHAADMGFDWVYINPFHYAGFSGSLYAVKEYYRLNPLFAPAGRERDVESVIRELAAEARAAGVRLMMDLVINHTSKDSPLVADHPDWYVRGADGQVRSPQAIDPADARRVTVWGDLAEIDNRASSARESLWAYWERLVEFYSRAGFEGFRCDAAYQVPAELWGRLIGRAKAIRPESIFLAETLGCRLEEIESLRHAGFDLIYSSSRWWDFSETWCLEQHEAFRTIAPSVSFPESHDTERLAAETSGKTDVARQRYVFASMFSSGILVPMGFEYGF